MNTKQVKRAQRNRRLIAQTFARLTDDQLDVTEFLQNSPTCLNRVRVYDVVRRMPHMGGDGAEKVCRRAKVWPLTRMGNLTEDERERLIAALPPRAKGQV